MHQQLRSFYRHLLQGLTLGLSAVGLFSSAARSHHDDVPDPPPQSSSNHLAALPNLVPTAITVSGISSGGFFAHQFHVAYSKLVNGAGIIAGGPFACVENVPNPYYVFWTVPLDRVSAATVACTHYFGNSYFGLRPSTPKAESSLEAIRQARRRRAIDDPANLADDRVWLFHGEHDEIVPEPVARSLEEVYRALGVLDLQADWNDHGRAALARHHSRHSQIDDVELTSELPSPERDVLASQTLDLLLETIEQLPPKCKQVFLLSRASDMTYPEIAAHCGISVKMVEKHISRAIAACLEKVGSSV